MDSLILERSKSKCAAFEPCWRVCARIGDDELQRLVVCLQDEWSSEKVKLEPFASPPSGQSFLFDLAVLLLDVCELSAGESYDFPL